MATSQIDNVRGGRRGEERRAGGDYNININIYFVWSWFQSCFCSLYGVLICQCVDLQKNNQVCMDSTLMSTSLVASSFHVLCGLYVAATLPRVFLTVVFFFSIESSSCVASCLSSFIGCAQIVSETRHKLTKDHIEAQRRQTNETTNERTNERSHLERVILISEGPASYYYYALLRREDRRKNNIL